jgi:hypothetical protein
MARRWIHLLSVALGVAAVIFCFQETRSHRRQRATLEHLQREADRHRELIGENKRLRGSLISIERPNLAALLRDLDDARNNLRSLQRLHTTKSKFVWPDGATVLDAKQWKNRGGATASNAIESFLWAARSGTIDQLKGLIRMQPLTRAEATSAFDQLPAATQAEYGTPEKLIATYIAATLPDFDATAEIRPIATMGPISLASYRLADSSGDQRDFTFLLMKSPEGTWQLCVPHSAVAQYVADLQGHPALK